MNSVSHVASVAEAIQLAVAPVFLLAGVGATLNVLAARIGRIIDRARVMEDRLPQATAADAASVRELLNVLSRRATLMNCAIAMSVMSGLLVSLVVAGMFVSASLRIDLAIPIAIVFVTALMSLAGALLCFLREVFMAIASLTFGGVRKQ